MLYATRNSEGKITGISDTPSSSSEPLDNNHPDVKEYFSRHYSDFAPDTFLDDSDVAVTRILDDLVDLLVKKNVIMCTELPAEAQKKLVSRRVVRSLIQDNETGLTNVVTDDIPSLLSDEDALL